MRVKYHPRGSRLKRQSTILAHAAPNQVFIPSIIPSLHSSGYECSCTKKMSLHLLIRSLAAGRKYLKIDGRDHCSIISLHKLIAVGAAEYVSLLAQSLDVIVR